MTCRPQGTLYGTLYILKGTLYILKGTLYVLKGTLYVLKGTLYVLKGGLAQGPFGPRAQMGPGPVLPIFRF